MTDETAMTISFAESGPVDYKRLADVGYHCGLIGKLHLASAWNGIEERVEDGYTDFRYSHAPLQNFHQGNVCGLA